MGWGDYEDGDDNDGDDVHCDNNDNNDNEIMNKKNNVLQMSYHLAS